MTTTPSPVEPGRGSAVLVYILYLLSIPSAALFALVGVILALGARQGAGPVARSHLDYQVKIWFTSFWWTVAIILLAIIGWITTLIGIGFIILWICGIIAFVIFVWFTIVSLLGLLALMDNRPK